MTNLLARCALPALFGALALSGCALLPEEKPETVSRAQTRIISTAPLLAGLRGDTISFEDRWMRQDYTILRKDGVQAEFLYSTSFFDALPKAGVLEVSENFDRADNLWTLNTRHQRQVGAVGRVDRVGQALFYRPYRITDLNWSCLALNSVWDTINFDIEFRPSKAVTGYICDTRGAAMTPERALQIARSLTFIGQDTPREPPLPIDSPQGSALMAEARGQSVAGDRTGIEAFPMRIGRELLDRSTISDGEGGGAIGGI